VAALIALAEHIALWQEQDRLPLVARYTLGMLSIYAGIAVFLRRIGLGWLVLPLFIIPCAAGLVVAVAHILRHSTPDTLDTLLDDGDSYAVWMPRVKRTG
jgi:hypothetical protein